MPIYSYKCDACGDSSDVLQKISEAPLSICPSCGKETYTKQLTAAGFVLKGGGWYVTDFKDQKKQGHDNSKVQENKDKNTADENGKTQDEGKKSKGAKKSIEKSKKTINEKNSGVTGGSKKR